MPGNPPTLIDKSFLQSLSLDEAFWFFSYFDGVLTPVLIAELIGDLEKTYRDGRDPTQMVSSMARKLCRTPEKLLNVGHADLGSYELLGESIRQRMRPIVHGTRITDKQGRTIELSDNFELLNMLQAWDDGKFDPIEFNKSRMWRDFARQFDPSAIIGIMSDTPRPKELDKIDLETVRSLHVSNLLNKDRSRENLRWAFSELNIPKEGQREIRKRWLAAGKPSLYDFAPYVAFLLLAIKTHLFASGLELTGSKQRSNDVIDIQYLFYIPFCRFFVTNDKFQLRFIEVLGEEGQIGINGSEMKSSLGEIVRHFGGSPLSRQMCLSKRDLQAPPKSIQNHVTTLWDFARPNWR